MDNSLTQKALRDLADVNPEKDKKIFNKTNLEVSFVPMENVDEVKGVITKQNSAKLGDVIKGHPSFIDGDIIFAKITPCMENGKCAIAKNLTNNIGFGSTEFYVIRCNDNVLPEYIWHFLRQENVRRLAKESFTGAVGHKRVPKEFIECLQIPIPCKEQQPDLEKQSSLIDKINNLFHEIDKGMEKIRAALETAQKLLQSELRIIYSDTNLKKLNLEDILSALESGSRPKGGAVSAGIPSIGAEHLGDLGEIKLLKRPKYIPEEYFKKMKKGIINQNDILVVKDGATTGKVSFIDSNFKISRSAVNEHVFILRTKENVFQKYLFYYLFSFDGKKEIMKGFGGAAQGGINTKFIRNINLPLPFKNNEPDLEEQKRIVERLDKIRTNAVNLENILQKQLDDFGKLQQSILKQAFQGKL